MSFDDFMDKYNPNPSPEAFQTGQKAWEAATLEASAKIEALKSTLKVVSGCQAQHNTPKLCGGCLAEINEALAR